MRGLLQVGHGQWAGGRIVGPPEHFVVQRQRRIVLDLVQQLVPLVLRQDVKRMDGLRDVISGERQLAFRPGVHVSAVLGKHRLSAVGAYRAVLADHLQQVLFRVRDVEPAAVFAADHPLGLAGAVPQQRQCGVSGFRGSGVPGEAPENRGRHHLVTDVEELVFDVLDFMLLCLLKKKIPAEHFGSAGITPLFNGQNQS